MLSLLISIIALGFIIFFHELGHFLAAKRCGVGVVEFSLGMGPRLLSKVRGNTRYSLRVLPFGGSCMMVGEEFEENGNAPADGGAAKADPSPAQAVRRAEAEENIVRPGAAKVDAATGAVKAAAEIPADAGNEVRSAAACAEEPVWGEPALQKTAKAPQYAAGSAAEDGSIEIDGRQYRADEAFTQKPAWQRFCIIAAGPVFNFILAFLLSLVLTQQVGYDRPEVLEVQADMPAAQSGIEAGDLIYSINGERVTVYRDIQLFLLANQRELSEGLPIRIIYENQAGELHVTEFQPKYAEDTQSYRMGLTFNAGYVPVSSFGELLKYSAYNVEFCIKSTVKSLQMIFAGKVQKDDVMGPVRMVATIDNTVETASQYGVWTTVMSLFDLVILISASLGAMNLLPVPALDGGQLVFILIEMIARRPVPREWIARINMIGMALLLALMFFVLFNDVSFILR